MVPILKVWALSLPSEAAPEPEAAGVIAAAAGQHGNGHDAGHYHREKLLLHNADLLYFKNFFFKGSSIGVRWDSLGSLGVSPGKGDRRPSGPAFPAKRRAYKKAAALSEAQPLSSNKVI